MNGLPLRPTDRLSDPAWITAQNERTHAWMCRPEHLPIRKQVRQRLEQLLASLNQAKSPAADSLSPDGRWRVMSTTNPATELQSWQLWQVGAASSQPYESISDVYPTGIAWRADGHGFYYDRFLAYPGAHALYFHRSGTSQRQDRCVFYNATQPAWHYQPTVSPDGRWLAVAILNHSACNRLTLLPLPPQPDATEGSPLALIPHFSGRYDILHWRPDRLILRSIEPDTPNGRLLRVDLATLVERCSPHLRADLPLVDAAPVGNGWVIHYLQGGCAEIQICDADGTQHTTIPLPGLGTVLWIEGGDTPSQVRYCYTDHSRPPQVYCWEPEDNVAKPSEPYLDLPYNSDDFVTYRRWIASSDGILVPLFLSHRRDLALKQCPTLLSVYGGLGHLHTPQFSVDALLWMTLGGVYATVCCRGGGELGADWHQAAVGSHKQHTFDDLLAVADWLIAQGITAPDKLGLWGMSNGGLTAAACLTQAPHLFGAVVIESGLLDMLNYHQLGHGAVS
ncbi:MAG: prolyl oligopeptidase family serine peptidase [Caldilineaceae bacterium]